MITWITGKENGGWYSVCCRKRLFFFHFCPQDLAHSLAPATQSTVYGLKQYNLYPCGMLELQNQKRSPVLLNLNQHFSRIEVIHWHWCLRSTASTGTTNDQEWGERNWTPTPVVSVSSAWVNTAMTLRLELGSPWVNKSPLTHWPNMSSL